MHMSAMQTLHDLPRLYAEAGASKHAEGPLHHFLRDHRRGAPAVDQGSGLYPHKYGALHTYLTVLIIAMMLSVE